jgi:hypothetical protein
MSSKITKKDDPSAATLREMPEVTDMSHAIRNPFAESLRRTGIRVRIERSQRKPKRQTGPSKASLDEIPEMDVKRGLRDPDRFAKSIAEHGFILHTRPGRPKRDEAGGHSSTRTVRFPDAVWDEVQRLAERDGLSMHAAIRQAILNWKDSRSGGHGGNCLRCRVAESTD